MMMSLPQEKRREKNLENNDESDDQTFCSYHGTSCQESAVTESP